MPTQLYIEISEETSDREFEINGHGDVNSTRNEGMFKFVSRSQEIIEMQGPIGGREYIERDVVGAEWKVLGYTNHVVP